MTGERSGGGNGGEARPAASARATGSGTTLAARPGDDEVLPFRTVRSGVEGRLVRLSGVALEILGRHDYPEPVSRALGEALALVAMLGTPLADGGRLILEVRSDGPLRSLAANFEQPGRLRGYAGFDRAAVLSLGVDTERLFGGGHLALTMDPAAGDSYQGVVAIEDGIRTVAEAATAYFVRSEGLPTFIRLAVARELSADRPDAPGGDATWHWRVGGLMIQHLGATAGAGTDDADIEGGLDEGEAEGGGADESWRRARLLAETVEDHELIDPAVTPPQLLLRLFHEEGVHVRPALRLSTYCRCSRERIARFLDQLEAGERQSLAGDDGRIAVTCEFCGRSYAFDRFAV